MSEDDGRVDKSVHVGISVQVSHAGLSALPDLGDQPGRMIGSLQGKSRGGLTLEDYSITFS